MLHPRLRTKRRCCFQLVFDSLGNKSAQGDTLCGCFALCATEDCIGDFQRGLREFDGPRFKGDLRGMINNLSNWLKTIGIEEGGWRIAELS